MPTTISIGRAPSNHIVVQHPAVSGTHALITFIEDGMIVYSDKSTNGSTINGKALRGSAAYIKVGDQILLPGNILLDWATLNRYNPYSPVGFAPQPQQQPQQPVLDESAYNRQNETQAVDVPAEEEESHRNVCGLLSLILSLVAIPFYFFEFIGAFFSFAAFVLGIIGLFFKPKGKAIAGLILSLVIPGIIVLIVLAIVDAGLSMIDSIYY